jgi:hypothetical protein
MHIGQWDMEVDSNYAGQEHRYNGSPWSAFKYKHLIRILGNHYPVGMPVMGMHNNVIQLKNFCLLMIYHCQCPYFWTCPECCFGQVYYNCGKSRCDI